MTLERVARIASAALLLGGGGFALYEVVEAPNSAAIAGVVDRGPRHAGPPRVALTFDDGPDAAVTPRVLATLREQHAVATFFVVGDAVRRHPALALRAARENNELENHTRTHAHLDWLSPARAAAEIRGGADDIAAVTGRRPRWLRPPFGRRDHAAVAAARAAGMRVVTWTVEPRSAADVQRLLDRCNDGSIVLLHDGDGGRDGTGGYTNESALTAAVIAGLRHRGFSLVRLDALFDQPDRPGRPAT